MSRRDEVSRPSLRASRWRVHTRRSSSVVRRSSFVRTPLDHAARGAHAAGRGRSVTRGGATPCGGVQAAQWARAHAAGPEVRGIMAGRCGRGIAIALTMATKTNDLKTTRDAGRDAADKASDAASDAADKVRDKASDTADKVREKASDVADKVRDTAREAKRKIDLRNDRKRGARRLAALRVAGRRGVQVVAVLGGQRSNEQRCVGGGVDAKRAAAEDLDPELAALEVEALEKYIPGTARFARGAARFYSSESTSAGGGWAPVGVPTTAASASRSRPAQRALARRRGPG